LTLIYIIAGEQSGDALGARLMTALRRLRPGMEFAGIGGAQMQAQGLASLFPMRELAVMGLLEVLPKLLRLRGLLNAAVADIAARKPALVITIDSPGFALRVLARVAALGIPRVHYVAPQVWAWREKRVRHYPGLWDRLLCLLPFEPAFFARHGLVASFVGHPVLESGAGDGDGARFRARHGLPPEARVLVLMPGSRRGEVTRLLPVFEATMALLATSIPGLVPVVPAAESVADAVREATSTWRAVPIVVTDLQDKHDAYAAAAVALTKSGTSTVELALAGVPMVVTYKVNALTAAIARRLFVVKHAALVNLLAGREVVPELIQNDCTPPRLAAEIATLLTDPKAAEAQRAGFREVMGSLAPPRGTPSMAAALEVLALLAETEAVSA
jgi:lipid-A-disaccharide synthase